MTKAKLWAETQEYKKRCHLWLLMHYHTIWPVRVRWVETLEDHWGSCTPYHNSHFLILLRKQGMTPEMVVSTLIHEWAHAMTIEFLGFGREDNSHHAAFAAVCNEIEQHWKNSGREEAARIPKRCLR